MDSIDHIEDCIIVAVGQDDLALACKASCEGEPCDKASLLPKEPPIPAPPAGISFEPFHVPDREPTVASLPESPVELFQLFIPRKLVESWVKWTNEAPAPGPQGPPQRKSRKLGWAPTSVEEVYLFLGILLYMGTHIEKAIKSYWQSSLSNRNARHHFPRFMPQERFELLLRRLRIFDTALFEEPSQQVPSTAPPEGRLRRGRQQGRQQQQQQPQEPIMPKVYRQVNGWSEYIQRVCTELYIPGACLTVDECMVRFTGRSVETTTLPTKPIPTGYKV